MDAQRSEDSSPCVALLLFMAHVATSTMLHICYMSACVLVSCLPLGTPSSPRTGMGPTSLVVVFRVPTTGRGSAQALKKYLSDK